MTGNQAGGSADAQARLTREKIKRLERSAAAWEAGAVGEQATGEVLSRLDPSQWVVWHDVRWPGRARANLDHVVIGPPGVFVIDSKNWAGTVVVADGHLRHNGRSREPSVAGAEAAARAVGELVAGVPVHPVLCFVRDDALTGWLGTVMVCSTANLDALLRTRPAQLTPDDVRRVARDLEPRLRVARPAAGRPSASRGSRSKSKKNSRKRKKQPLLGPLLRFALGVTLLLGFTSEQAEPVRKWIGSQIAGAITPEPPDKSGKKPRQQREQRQDR